MDMLKKWLPFLLTIVLVTINISLFAQSVKRQSLNSWGSIGYGDGYYVKQTVGQSSNTAEFKGKKIMFRQGFQQAPIDFSKIKANESCQLLLYPNPIISEAVLIVPLKKTKSYSIWICDILGKVIHFEENITVDKIGLSAKDFIAGEYFIKVLYEDKSCCSIKFIVVL